ncbi:MAG: hypothetical protein SYC29_00140 [Planctomycetota bacterium]|nr:hypothetical protein [Planctomycetota bacterium]
MSKGQRVIATLLGVIAVVLALNLLHRPPAAVASPATDAGGLPSHWGVAVNQDAWALVKGSDGLAYIVTPSGWRTAESVQHGRRGPLHLD